MADEVEPYVADTGIARTVGCTKHAVRVWKRQGMPVHRFGRLVRYKLSECVAWHEQRQRAAQDAGQEAA